MTHTLRLPTALLGATLAALLLAAACGGGPAPGVVAEGLASPRGLTPLPDGGLLVAELGAGRVLRLDPASGAVSVHAEGLPRLADGPEGAPAGVSAAIVAGGVTYAAVGEARAKGFREVYAIGADGVPRGVTGQDVAGTRPALPLLNPYDIALLPGGDLLVSDAGANVVWRVTPAGEITTYADPGPIPYAGPQGAAEAEPVPTGMGAGPDGAVYLATLTGAPFPAGAATVFRMLDRNGDGDALDAGETTLYAQGFTVATDVAFAADGSLLVTEYTGDMAALAAMGYARSAERPGRLVRWRRGALSVVAEGLVSPTSVAVADGLIYVSEEYAGRVRAIAP